MVPSTQCPECGLKGAAGFRVYPWHRHLILYGGSELAVEWGEGPLSYQAQGRLSLLCNQEYISLFPEEFRLNITYHLLGRIITPKNLKRPLRPLYPNFVLTEKTKAIEMN